MSDILDDLIELHKQATTEHSHYYVAKTAERAIAEIKSLRAQFKDGVMKILDQVQTNKTVIDDATARLDKIERQRS